MIPPKGWVAPFGHLGINACSRLPQDFRSVPRPSSPPGAKASTRCPSLAQKPGTVRPRQPPVVRTRPGPTRHCPQASHRTHPTVASCPSPVFREDQQATGTAEWINTHTHFRIPGHNETVAGRQSSVARDTPPQPTACAHRAVPHAPRDATEPDSQSPKNTTTNQKSVVRRQTPNGLGHQTTASRTLNQPNPL
jgi:hypothetical protein